MKSTKSTLLLLGLLVAAMVSGSALANGGHGRYRTSVGVYVGPGFWPGYYYPPRYYYPPPYYPPVVVAPAQPPVYVEQNSSAAAPAAQGSWWYYCADSQSYYPYVRECPTSWQRVAPVPPS